MGCWGEETCRGLVLKKSRVLVRAAKVEERAVEANEVRVG